MLDATLENSPYPSGTKKCTACKDTLSINDFHKTGKYRQSKCKKCMVEYSNNWKASHAGSLLAFREKDKQRMQNLRQQNPEHYKLIARKARLRKIGSSPEEYESKFQTQNGCCAVCGGARATYKKDFAQDHNHLTGKIRGLLCSPCNTA